MSLQHKVLSYLAEAEKPKKKRAFFAFLGGKKATSPEDRVARLKQRINIAKTKIETLTHQLQKVSDSVKQRELRQLKAKTESLLQNLKSKLEEISRFAREFKQGIQGKGAGQKPGTLTASVSTTLGALTKEISALEVLTASYRKQGDDLLREVFRAQAKGATHGDA